MTNNQSTDQIHSERSTSEKYFSGAGLCGTIIIGTGGITVLREMEKPTYQKVQQALGNAPEQLQQAVDTCIQAHANGNNEQMKQSIDAVVLARKKITTSYYIFEKDFGERNNREASINLMGLGMDARVTLTSMNALYKNAKGEKTPAGKELTEEEKENCLDDIMDQGARIPYDAIVQQRVNDMAGGKEQYTFGTISITLAIIAGYLLYKGARERRKEKVKV